MRRSARRCTQLSASFNWALSSSSAAVATALLRAKFQARFADLTHHVAQGSPPAKAPRAFSGGSPLAARRAVAALDEPGSSAAVALVVSDSPPRRALALVSSTPRVALATVQERAASFKPKAEPQVLFSPPPPQLADDDDDDDELPPAPFPRPLVHRPAAAPEAPASDRKVAATLWPDDDDDGASVSASSDGEEECTDESAAAAEAALKNFGHLDDQLLDPALLVDVRTRLKPHQLIFCRWARDRPAVILQAYDHSSQLLLTAPLRSCEWRSLLAAPSSLPRFAAPTSSSPRHPSSPLPPARANLALPGSSAGPRRPRPPPPARAGLALLRLPAQARAGLAHSSLHVMCRARTRTRASALVPAN